VACLLLLIGALALFRATNGPAVEPLNAAGSAATAGLTVMPGPATAAVPTTEPAPNYTQAEVRYLQVLHERDEVESEYAPDGSMVLIGGGICARRDAGDSVSQLVAWVDGRGYSSLASGWIVGSAVREMCPPAGDR
jgi:hypothetical protein